MLFQKSVKQIGLNATIRHMRNLGIDFVDAYVMLFGRMPKVI